MYIRGVLLFFSLAAAYGVVMNQGQECGGDYEPMCNDSLGLCEPGLQPTGCTPGSTCWPCGGQNRPCCHSEPRCEDDTLQCSESFFEKGQNLCLNCGDEEQPPCGPPAERPCNGELAPYPVQSELPMDLVCRPPPPGVSAADEIAEFMSAMQACGRGFVLMTDESCAPVSSVPAQCGHEGQPICSGEPLARSVGVRSECPCMDGLVAASGVCMPAPVRFPGFTTTTATTPCGVNGEPVCEGREFECDYGFVGEETTTGRMCVPWMPESVSSPGSTSCGSNGEPACEGRELECDDGFVGAETTTGRMCVPWMPRPAGACGQDGEPICAGRELECDFGYVGADTATGRMCVPFPG